jgi:YfiH family protein
MNIAHAPNLSSANIAHGFFDRTGGVSKGIFESLNCGPGSGDDPAAVSENRRRACATLAHGAILLTLYQVHGADAVTVSVPWGAERPRADAMVTNKPNLALGILTADCAPVLLADPEAGVIGAAHAGWKGALAGVTDATIVAMEGLGARRNRIAAAIGPCISQENYEVGSDFREEFVRRNGDNRRFFAEGREGHFHFDLQGYVNDRLRAANLMSIDPLRMCTYQSGNFFSFRRATHLRESDYGRQVSAIVLK